MPASGTMLLPIWSHTHRARDAGFFLFAAPFDELRLLALRCCQGFLALALLSVSPALLFLLLPLELPRLFVGTIPRQQRDGGSAVCGRQ